MRRQLSEIFILLADGEDVGMPLSRHMPVIRHGVHELRVKDRTGQFRIFYYTKKVDAILIFHFFKKKTQETPLQEIETAKGRLEELL